MRKKWYTHLSAEDRETLSLGLAHGHSIRAMARVGCQADTLRYRISKTPVFGITDGEAEAGVRIDVPCAFFILRRSGKGGYYCADRAQRNPMVGAR